MLSYADASLLLVVVVVLIGAIILAALLLYARREYGPRKSRTIGAILIDANFGFAAKITILCVLVALRPLGIPLEGVPLMIVRYALVAGYCLVIWWPVCRLLAWLWKGDNGQTEPRNSPGTRIFDSPKDE